MLFAECQRTLRLAHLLLRLVDASLLRVDLRVDVADLGLRLLDLRDRLIEGGAIVTIINWHQRCAGGDQLIVGHRNIDDGAIDLGADGNGASIDERVIG